jgi:hypothetical protein
MADSATLLNQVDLVKAKIDELAAATLDSQDLVFLAKALESIGNLLGINDIIGVTNSSILEVQNASDGQVALVATAGSAQINAIVTSGNQQISLVESAVDNYSLFVNMGVI